MAINEKLTHKGLVAITLFVFSGLFLRLLAVPHPSSYLPWIGGTILLGINSEVQKWAKRATGFGIYIITLLITFFGSGLYRLYSKTRKLYIVLAFLTLFFLTPRGAFAFTITEPPEKIIIPSARISLPVYTAKIAYDTWEVRTDGASFGQYTTIPGRPGNTVIFSHAMPHLFGSLDRVRKGEYIHVFTKYDWFVYKVTETLTVSPENTEVIFASHNHELTLYTCTGLNYEKRFIVKARLISPPTL